jgi:hypothetical protein
MHTFLDRQVGTYNIDINSFHNFYEQSTKTNGLQHNNVERPFHFVICILKDILMNMTFRPIHLVHPIILIFL